MSTIFLQQILSDRLLRIDIGGLKKKISSRFKLKPITTFNL